MTNQETNRARGGSWWDRKYFTDDELRDADEARRAAAAGEIGWADAHSYVEGIREKYGYSGGTDGSGYTALRGAPRLPDAYGAPYAEAVRRYTEMAPFEYDHNTDPRWEAYRKEYVREGRRAAEDTLGQVSARTGGMPSTAAVTAAQQAGDYYAAKLADKVPELYELAYAMYTGEADRLYRQLTALRGARADEQERWQAQLAQWNADRSRDDALSQQAWQRAQTERAYADSRADRAADEAYRARTYADARADAAAAGERTAASDAWARAVQAAEYGDWSGLEALGVRVDERMKNAPALTLAQVNEAVRSSNLAPNVLSAWEYYYGAPYAAADTSGAGGGGGKAGGGGKDGGEETSDPEDLSVDYASVLDLGYGPISARKLAALVETGEVAQYEADGKLRYRRVRSAQPPEVPSFDERFRALYG